MLNINKEVPVMVTGATGYIAGQLIKRLLNEGLTVHAAVRNPENTENLKYLNQLGEKAAGSIKYFKADLLKSDSYKEAMAGCNIVFHMASPFIMEVKDPQKELVDPALQGTRNVLESVNQTKSVKRVVLTSSCAAIYGDNIDLLDNPKHIFTEENWNTTSSLIHNPYSYSKTLAEKEAWKINEQQSHWSLVTVNPSLVMGPGINPFASAESYKIIKQFGDGTLKTGVPNWGLGIVDVRDVAEAHLRAAFLEKAQGRYITSGHSASFPKMAESLTVKYGKDYPIPKRVLPKALIWLFGPLINKGMTRKVVSRNINYAWAADNTKSINELGVHYRSLDESMNEFFQQLIDHKIL